MKKFYTLAAAALATMSMSAQLYLCGNGDGLGWEPSTPLEVTAGADGNYTFDIKNLVSLKVSSVKSSVAGDWAEWNTGNKNTVEAPSKDNLGTAIGLDPYDGPANIDMPWKGDYHVVINGDFTTITLTTTTPEPDENAPKIFGLRGSMNGWGNDGLFEDAEWCAKWLFSKVTDTEYVWVGTLAKGDAFKIADADWGSINYGAGAGAMIYPDDDTQWDYDAKEGTMAEDFDGEIRVTLPSEAKGALAVVFSEDSSVANIAVENGVAEYFNLQGVRVANPENGLFIVRKAGKTAKVVL